MLPCPGYSDEIIHLYMARDLKPLIQKPEGDPDEDIEVLKMSVAELNLLISSGEEALDGKRNTRVECRASGNTAPTADSRPPTADSRQPTADSRPPTVDSSTARLTVNGRSSLFS